jgi:DNA-binding NarL/FixJ family response regulator
MPQSLQSPLYARPSAAREPENVRSTCDASRSEAEMEQEADALLGRCVMLGSDSGVYTQAQLDRKARDEQKRMPMLAEGGASEAMIEHLLERQMRDLIDAANLTALQEIIYRLHVAGFNGKRIAEVLGIRRRTTEQRLRTVKRKVRAAYEQGRYAGWYEVYLSEVNRLACRPERH